MLEHVVEREQAPHQHFGRRDPSSSVVPGTKRLVDPAPVDPADPVDAVDAGRLLLDGHALGGKLAERRGQPFRGGTRGSPPTVPW